MKNSKIKTLKKGAKPLYHIFMGRKDGGYYKGASAWKSVSKENADKLTHKEANKIEGKLRRLGYTGSVMELI